MAHTVRALGSAGVARTDLGDAKGVAEVGGISGDVVKVSQPASGSSTSVDGCSAEGWGGGGPWGSAGSVGEVPCTTSRPNTVALLMGEMYSGDRTREFGSREGRLPALDHLGRDGESIDALEANGMIIWVPVPAEPLALGNGADGGTDGGVVVKYDSGERMSLEGDPSGAAVAAVLSARGALRYLSYHSPWPPCHHNPRHS